MNGGKISGNAASVDDTYSGGGGVYVYRGTFTMNGGEISGNTASVGSGASSSYYNGGGGVYVYSNGTFTMNGGEISGNAASGGYGRGGGVCSYEGSIRMSGGVIYGSNAVTGLRNTAGREGAMLYRRYGTAQYGTFSGDTFYSSGDLTTWNTTIRIVNGNLLTE